VRVGYARVSTIDQSPGLQLDALRRAGCEKTFTEAASGAKADRPELARVLRDYLRQRERLLDHAAVGVPVDRSAPLAYEPSGEDFLSPALAEADVMRRIMPPGEFAGWLEQFLPGIPKDASPDWLKPGVVTDPADGKLVKSLDAQDGPVTGVAVNADATRLVSCGTDKTVKVFTLPANPGVKEEKPVAIPLPAAASAVALSPNGQRIAVAVAGEKVSRVHVFDAANGKELLVFAEHAGAIPSLSFLADNRTLVSAGADTTLQRPGAPTVGAQFYDTTLSKPIWFDGSVWRDASGTAV